MAAIKEVSRRVILDHPQARNSHRFRESLEPLMALFGMVFGWFFASAAAVVALLIIVIG